MGFVIGNVPDGLWPNATIPYEIDDMAFPPGPTYGAARTIVMNAINTFNTRTVIKMRPRNGEGDYIVFEPNTTRCNSYTGRRGGRQSVACALPIDPVAVPGGQIAFDTQGHDQVTALTFDQGGALSASWVIDIGAWQGPIPVTAPGTAPPGAPLATARQGNNQLTTVFIDNDGALAVAWVEDQNPWNGPAKISPNNVAQPGAAIALAKQGDNQLTAVFFDQSGALNVAWVQGVDPWQGPAKISPNGTAPAGAGIALGHQSADLLTAAFIDSNGALNVAWVIGGGAWQGPVKASPDNIAVPGAPIAMAPQVDGQLTAVYFDRNGALTVSWVDAPGQPWKGPAQVSPNGTVAPGSRATVALAKQSDTQLTAVFTNAAGALCVSWVEGVDGWKGPVQIGGTGVGGGGVALIRQRPGVITAMTTDPSGMLMVAWAAGVGAWQGPAPFRSGQFNINSIIHELCHAAGLLHEHQRPDRDTYVNYMPANAGVGFRAGDFDIDNSGRIVGPYDCGSLMHYRANAFAMPGTQTLAPIATAACSGGVGNNNRGLTWGDMNALADLYGFPKPHKLPLHPTVPMENPFGGLVGP